MTAELREVQPEEPEACRATAYLVALAASGQETMIFPAVPAAVTETMSSGVRAAARAVMTLLKVLALYLSFL